ncbi:hypothetical protein [Cesiribacter andamanensis]|uniref:Glycosyltransferase RgtA/B/C/D-like domain-containing protein n=1 Tax=Cesiribacter andamanensis AMV16 TaxID=1279009 RepID=M7NAQ2_9BACT|nr:hypothetical protein [Cesiribacter andamanensis]EMR04332.1 hypothetical protein ADICEAN_00495 [Cesiribacter andamanensis AMV16]
MIAFFRLNDPYRLIGIFLLLLVLRLPALLGWIPALQPQLGWMVLGENLAAGDSLYEGIWDNTGPFAAAVYWLLDALFGRSLLAHSLLAMLVVLIQAAQFNLMLLNFRAYNENTYVPALIYTVLAHLFYDFYLLSPPLLCLTFLLLALRNSFKVIAGMGKDESLFFLGAYIGVAAGFYLPALAYLPALLFALLLFTGTKPRQYLLLLIGAALPLVSITLYFFWQDNLQNYYFSYFLSLSIFGTDNYLSTLFLLGLATIPTLFFLVGLYRFSSRNYTITQTRMQQAIFYFLIAGLIAIFFSAERSGFHLLLLVPAWAFYISHYLLLIRQHFKAELIFWGFCLLLVALNVLVLTRMVPELDPYIDTERLHVQPRPEQELVEGKKILSLGRDLSLYQHARLATPYLEWRLATRQLSELNYYDNLVDAFSYFHLDTPQVLVDDAGIVPQLFERMPTIASRYQQSSRFPHVYVLREKGVAAEDN